MDEETIKRIADFFDPWDLVEYLQLKAEDIILAFPDEVEEALEEIEELMEFRK